MSETTEIRERPLSRWVAVGAIVGGLGVILGAFGAHGIEDRLIAVHGTEPKTVAGFAMPAAHKYLRDYRTGAMYHLVHAAALVGVGLAGSLRPRPLFDLAGWSFLGGVLLFSGALYALAWTGVKAFGAVAPVGGTLLIVGWGAFVAGAWGRRPDGPTSRSGVADTR